MTVKAIAIAAAAAILFIGCKPKSSETDTPPVNQPRPNPVVKPTNQVQTPLTNVPAERSATNR